MQTQDEKISLINGRIHTLTSTASSITFEHGRITSIDDEPGTLNGRVIDLQGRTVLPAFCDTGLNLLGWAEAQERLSLTGTRSLQDLTSALAEYSRANPSPLRGWYVAQGLPEGLKLTHDDIDDVIPAIPCAVIDPHNARAVLNSAAMHEFNMPQDSVELDEFNTHLPPLSEEDIIGLVKTCAQKINALGITEVWADFRSDSQRLWDIFSSDAYDSLTFRLRCNFGYSSVNDLNEFLASGLRTGDGLPFCRLGGIIVDDSAKQDEQKNMINSAHLSGCQLITGSSKECLTALERVSQRFTKNSRHLIRSSVLNNTLLERMRLLDVGGVTSPAQDEGMIHQAFRNGLVVSAASGNSLTSPMKNLSSMVINGLSVSEAVCVYSWSAAWNGRTESRRGDLVLGNDADIVVLEKDPFLVSPDEIAGIDVTMTFSAGVCVYDSGTI